MCENIVDVLQFCDNLLSSDEIQEVPMTHSSAPIINPHEETTPVIIKTQDVENLKYLVQYWTDIIEIKDVLTQYNNSDFDTLEKFEKYNNLYHMGFIYVRINSQLSSLEFFGLIDRIPWDLIMVPGLTQVNLYSLVKLLGEKEEMTALQLMAVGDYLQLWELINPNIQMKCTGVFTKKIITMMGNISINVSQKFIDHCREMIENFVRPSPP